MTFTPSVHALFIQHERTRKKKNSSFKLRASDPPIARRYRMKVLVFVAPTYIAYIAYIQVLYPHDHGATPKTRRTYGVRQTHTTFTSHSSHFGLLHTYTTTYNNCRRDASTETNTTLSLSLSLDSQRYKQQYRCENSRVNSSPMSEASLATSVPLRPMLRPTSAVLRAGASFVPSPVAPTTSPPSGRLADHYRPNKGERERERERERENAE